MESKNDKHAPLSADIDIKNSKTWYFDTRKHYKIWFSKNPREFMDMENQLRLVRLLTQNPSMKFTLIYSAKCLNESAILELLDFCKAYSMTLVNFDTDILGLLDHPLDIALYEKAKEEIDRTLCAKGGNFAAASDCIRLIIPVIAMLGMYNDFEKHLNVECYPPKISCSTPIILSPSNNDTIAVAFNPCEVTKVDEVALTMIRNAQEKLLDNYINYKNAIVSSNFFKNRAQTFYNHLTCQYIKKYPEKSLYDLRLFSEHASLTDLLELAEDSFYTQFMGVARDTTLTEEQLKTQQYAMIIKAHSQKALDSMNIGTGMALVEHQLKVIKENILSNTVVPISGPAVMNALFLNEFSPFRMLCSRDDNLKNLFETANPLFKPTAFKRIYDCDGSWGPLGEFRKKVESNNIKNSIHFFQKMIRGAQVRTTVSPALKAT